MPDESLTSREVNRPLVLLVFVMFVTTCALGWLAWHSYTLSERSQEAATKCLATVLDHEADTFVAVGAAFTTPAVGTNPATARVQAANGIVTAANSMKVASAKCIGTDVGPLPSTLPLPTTTVPPG
jgi:hypothetical protein